MTPKQLKILVESKTATEDQTLQEVAVYKYGKFPTTTKTVKSAMSMMNERLLLLKIRKAVEAEYLPWVEELVEHPNNASKRLYVRTGISDKMGEFLHAKTITNYGVICDETNNSEGSQDFGLPTVRVWWQISKNRSSICEITLRPLPETFKEESDATA